MSVDDIKEAILNPPPEVKFKPNQYLSSGSVLLNLALTDHRQSAFRPGSYYFFVGDSSSGKTFFTQTCFAEACRNPFFDKYDLVYYNIENGALMDRARFFGATAAARVKDVEGIALDNRVENFYYHLHDQLKRPTIAVVDSMDAFSSEYEQGKFKSKKKASEDGTKAAGDYGDGKAGINSRNVRSMLNGLWNTNSILILIGQTRDNIGGGMFDPPKVFAGGHALKFYASGQIWSTCGATITRDYKDHKIELGITSKLSIKKNRHTGKRRSVTVPIYHSFGIDDIGSCVDYLIDWKRWEKKSGGVIKAEQLG